MRYSFNLKALEVIRAPEENQFNRLLLLVIFPILNRNLYRDKCENHHVILP